MRPQTRDGLRPGRRADRRRCRAGGDVDVDVDAVRFGRVGGGRCAKTHSEVVQAARDPLVTGQVRRRPSWTREQVRMIGTLLRANRRTRTYRPPRRCAQLGRASLV